MEDTQTTIVAGPVQSVRIPVELLDRAERLSRRLRATHPLVGYLTKTGVVRWALADGLARLETALEAGLALDAEKAKEKS